METNKTSHVFLNNLSQPLNAIPTESSFLTGSAAGRWVVWSVDSSRDTPCVRAGAGKVRRRPGPGCSLHPSQLHKAGRSGCSSPCWNSDSQPLTLPRRSTQSLETSNGGLLLFQNKKVEMYLLLIITREHRVVLTLWTIVESYTDARKLITLARPAISEW